MCSEAALPVDFMAGGAGIDLLRGGGGDDSLTGGPGRDRVYGGGGEDTLVEGETDAQAAVDLFDGGPQSRTNTDTGDTLQYSHRRANLTIDLAAGATSTEDTFRRRRERDWRPGR